MAKFSMASNIQAQTFYKQNPGKNIEVLHLFSLFSVQVTDISLVKTKNVEHLWKIFDVSFCWASCCFASTSSMKVTLLSLIRTPIHLETRRNTHELSERQTVI